MMPLYSIHRRIEYSAGHVDVVAYGEGAADVPNCSLYLPVANVERHLLAAPHTMLSGRYRAPTFLFETTGTRCLLVLDSSETELASLAQDQASVRLTEPRGKFHQRRCHGATKGK